MDTLAKNAAVIQDDIARAQALWGHTVKLIAVTKTRLPEEITPLMGLGIAHIGENRVQEITEKAPLLDTNFHIYMIGQLQTNKVKYIIDDVCQIQSVDRLSLAKEINRRALENGKQMNVLVQVSPVNEPQKGGIAKEETLAFLKALSPFEGLKVTGLMAIMPLSHDQPYLDGLFRNMRTLFDRLRMEAVNRIAMDELSMGMSGDYRLALKNGATTIRVGTALFGTGR